MKKIYFSYYVPPSKEQLERHIKYYKKELKNLENPEYVKKMVEKMKKDLQDKIKECESELAYAEE